MELVYEITKGDFKKTINEIISKEFNFSNRLLTKLIKNKNVLFNEKKIDTRTLISNSGIIKIDFNYDEDNSNIVATKMNLDIVYEDEWMVVVNKPAGCPIHPSKLHFEDSLSNGIKDYFDSIKMNKKIRPVNRLDLNTSGLVIFAKCEYIQEQFSNQMANNLFKKEYLCLVDGLFKEKSGTIDLPISRKQGSIIERTINENGKKSITHYDVLKESDNYSLVHCKLETGRTHQIRVHMQAIGHPILGDTLYGKYSDLINRQALHSYKIQCIHPVTGKKLNLVSDLPRDMKQLIK